MAPKQWTEAVLDELANLGDPLADDTIAAIFRNHDTTAVNRVLQDLVTSARRRPDFTHLDPEVREHIDHYYEVSGRLPDWADQAQIQRGQELFEKHGQLAFLILGFASLPELYACGNGGTPVLAATQQLDKHVYRRVYETAQMLIDVMSRDGLTPAAEGASAADDVRHGRGIRAAQKVRLMHAAIRHLILEPADQVRTGPPSSLGDALQRAAWNHAAWGMPIGQEYMGATLQTFSYVILRGWRQLGVHVSAEDERAYIHCWNIVGHIMGVHPVFLDNVRTALDSRALFDAAMRRRLSRNDIEAEEGRRLTAALIRFFAHQVRMQTRMLGPFAHAIPADHIPRGMIGLLVGQRKAELLGVHEDFLDRFSGEVVAFFIRILPGLPARLSWHLVQGMFHMPRNDWNRELFYIPDHLAESWGVRPAAG